MVAKSTTNLIIRLPDGMYTISVGCARLGTIRIARLEETLSRTVLVAQ
jgi:hypothetical protein